MKKVKLKSGKVAYLPSLAECEAAVDESEGFCLACGSTQGGVEPDAEKYECEACGKSAVYGAEEFVLRGLFVSGKKAA